MPLNEQPLVSVVIPCYNHENFVQDCIQSVIEQTYENIELMIIDDGSKDGSVEKIKEMIPACQERFTRFEFRYRPNKGLSATLNEAIEWSEGTYFSALASDDQMLKDKTQFQVDYLNTNNDVIAVLGGVNWIDENNIIIAKYSNRLEVYDFNKIFLLRHKLNVCTQIVRLSALIEVGGYRNGYVIEDWYMWLKLVRYGNIVNLPNIFTNYRKHENNSINDGRFIYYGILQILNDYKDNPMYIRALTKATWIFTAHLFIIKDKSAIFYLKNLLIVNCFSIFSKDFIRCMRNLAISILRK